VCSEMWPGKTANVTGLVQFIERLRRRFAIVRVCIVADRGMISAETIAALEARGLRYILGVLGRTDKLVLEMVLNDTARFVPLVIEKRGKDTNFSAKAVTLGRMRYILCINHQEAAKDAADRAAILTALEQQLERRQGVPATSAIAAFS
jgi:Transposase DDE domain